MAITPRDGVEFGAARGEMGVVAVVRVARRAAEPRVEGIRVGVLGSPSVLGNVVWSECPEHTVDVVAGDEV